MFGSFGDPISYSDFFANTGAGGATIAVDNGDLQSIGPPPPMRGATDSYGNPLPPQPQPQTAVSVNDEVIRTTTTAAASRNVQDLQARIKASGGVLAANSSSSDYIVAINNSAKFSVTRNAATGLFEIRESSNYYYLIGAAVLIGVLLLSKK